MSRRSARSLKRRERERLDVHGETFQSGGRLIGMAKHRQVRRRAHKQRQKKPSAPRWKREPIDAWLDAKLRALGLGRLIAWIERACGAR